MARSDEGISVGAVRAGLFVALVRSSRTVIPCSRERAPDRRKLPWGLLVSVSGVSAVNGAWPLLPGGRGSVTEELVTRIRRQYKDGSALAALENALRIVRAYTPDRRAAA